MSVSVRTTFEPDKEIHVSVTEREDLRRQGLLVEEPTPEPEKPTDEVASKASAKTKKGE